MQGTKRPDHAQKGSGNNCLTTIPVLQLKSCRESPEATTKVCPSWLCACPGQRASCADKAIAAWEQEGALGRSDWLYLGNYPHSPPESSLGARMSQRGGFRAVVKLPQALTLLGDKQPKAQAPETLPLLYSRSSSVVSISSGCCV